MKRGSNISADSNMASASSIKQQAGFEPRYVLTVCDQSKSTRKMRFRTGNISIGSGDQNDIVLVDPDVIEEHMEIVLPSDPREGARILPKGGTVEIGGFGELQTKQFADVATGTSLVIGNSTIRISEKTNSLIPDHWYARGLATVCILLLVTLSWGWFARLDSTQPTKNAVAPPEIDNATTSSGSAETQETLVFDPERLDALVWTVRTQLEDLGIGDGLTVIPTVAGEIRVSGILQSRDREAWEAFLGWYESRTNYPPLNQSINQEVSGGPIPELNSIWLDDQPTVVFRSGSIAKVGSEIENGWIVVSIGRNAVVLTRDGSYITLKF